jgi:hypothetical protein
MPGSSPGMTERGAYELTGYYKLRAKSYKPGLRNSVCP